jgi:hypothetical protein
MRILCQRNSHTSVCRDALNDEPRKCCPCALCAALARASHDQAWPSSFGHPQCLPRHRICNALLPVEHVHHATGSPAVCRMQFISAVSKKKCCPAPPTSAVFSWEPMVPRSLIVGKPPEPFSSIKSASCSGTRSADILNFDVPMIYCSNPSRIRGLLTPSLCIDLQGILNWRSCSYSG